MRSARGEAVAPNQHVSHAASGEFTAWPAHEMAVNRHRHGPFILAQILNK